MGRTKYDNEFKVMIVELLNSGIKTAQVSDDYGLNVSMISRWKREFKTKLGDFSKKRVLSAQEQELKSLTKELRNVKEERDILKKAGSIFSKSDR
jgi:transposase